MNRFGWTHEKLMRYHALVKRGFARRTAARMALRDIAVVQS